MIDDMRPDTSLVTYNFPPMGGGVSRYYGELAKAYGPAMRVVSPFTDRGAGMPAGDGALTRLKQTAFVSRLDGSLGFPLVGHPHLALPFIARRASFGLVLHGGEWARVRRYGPAAVDRLASRARLLVVNSEATARRWAPRATGKTQVSVVHPGISSDWLANGRRAHEARAPKDGGPIRFLTVSRLVTRKRVVDLVRVFAELWNRYPGQFQLDVVGAGPEATRVREAADASPEAVAIHGEVDDAQLRDLYAQADVFALCPADLDGDEGFEGFGIVYLEAAAYGLPVVATRVGGVPEALSDAGAFGLEEHDWRGVRSAIEQLIQSRSLRREMAAANLDWAARNNWASRADKLAESIHDLK